MTVPQGKKRPPSPNEQAFIETARRIRIGQLNGNAPQEIAALSRHWQEAASELHRAYEEDGEDGFWKSYDALALDRPQLGDWKEMVVVKPEQAEEKKWGKYRPTTLLDMVQRPRPSDIIEDIFYEKTVGLLFGAAGTKKSFLTFDWCAHIAMNMSWQGHAIKKPGKCIYTLAEGADNFIKRALAWCNYHQIPLEKLSENLLLVEREIPLAHPGEVSEYITDVGEFIHNVQPVVVVFDTLMRCSGGENINAPDVMAKLYDGANRIRRELDAAHALIVHHEGKDSAKGSAGSFVLRANCDIAHRLASDETTGTLTLSCNPAVQGKMKDKAEYPDIYLNTRTVYYTEEQTKEDSSLVIVGGDKPVQGIKLTANRQMVLDALPQGAGLRFAEWKQAVDKAREADGLPPMPKQTFIDGKDWLTNHNLVRKTGTEDGTEQNTYWRVQEVGEE